MKATFYQRYIGPAIANTIIWFVVICMILGTVQKCTGSHNSTYYDDGFEDEREENHRWG